MKANFSLLLTAFIFLLPMEVAAEDWSVIPEAQERLSTSKPKPEPTPPADPYLDVYKPGTGTILGAFGIPFGEPMQQGVVVEHLGWQTFPKMPVALKYFGTLKPFNLPGDRVNPPEAPGLLETMGVRYFVYSNFEGAPLWIHTSEFEGAKPVLDVIYRKYGTPDETTEDTKTYNRDAYQLVISKKGNRHRLDYFDLQAFEDYLRVRNLPLKKKFGKYPEKHLTPQESQILGLATQVVKLRQNINVAFGQPFRKRVGFKATPDEFVPFAPTEPLLGLPQGDYEIMVNPNLIPVAIRYQTTGTRQALATTKDVMDQALDIAFGGFLKRTDRHTVLSFKGNALSVLVREDRLMFSVHDGAENDKHNARMKAQRVAAAQAKQDRERALAMEARRKEIEVEKGF